MKFTWSGSVVSDGCSKVKTYKFKYTFNGTQYGDEFDTGGNTYAIWNALGNTAKGKYCVWAKAVTEDGVSSGWSSQGCFDYNPPSDPPKDCKPTKPLNVKARLESNNDISITWDKPKNTGCNDNPTYAIEYKHDNNSWTSYKSVKSLDASFKAKKTGKYMFRVIIKSDKNDNVCSDPSNLVTVKSVSYNTFNDNKNYCLNEFKPIAPTDFIAEYESSTNRIIMSWLKPDVDDNLIQGFTIFKSIDDDDFIAFVTISQTSPLSFIDKDIENGHDYSYYIKTSYHGIDISESDASDAATISVPIYNPPKVILPSKPENISIRYDKDTKTVNLKWDKPIENGCSALISYKVYKYHLNDVELIGTVNSNDTLEYVDGNVIEGDQYQYYVNALSIDGEGEASTVTTDIPINDVNPPPDPTPPDPQPIKQPSSPEYFYAVFDPINNIVEMHWRKPDGCSDVYVKYKVYRSSNESVELIDTIESYLDLASFNDNNPKKGKWYYYVVASNDIGDSKPSESILIDVN